MTPVILIRSSLAEENEEIAAKQYFHTIRLRSKIPNGSLVIPRYSSLPYYREFEQDVLAKNSKVINTYNQHYYIANFDWFPPLAKYTFKTWDDSSFYDAPEGSYIVKGRTNSRKHRWNTHMFAKTKKDAIRLGADLAGDELLGPQGIIYREYVPLKTFQIGVNGLPFTAEWRFFFYRQKMIASGYYWSNSDYIDVPYPPDIDEFTQKIANETLFPTFYVLDVAEKADGGYILVEMNCGTMSGLSTIPPDVFYRGLRDAILS